ncbi:MAG: outer membrane lipoprotein carrier protein LolA [Bacteroidetes bacterium]|nr:outer membrane lipoprotein carrier protein LolA [Bacteroidota bacterium]
MKTLLKPSLIMVGMLTANLGMAQTDAKANELLNKVSKKYQAYSSIKAVFTVTTENQADKKKTTEEGTVYLKGSKFRLDFGGQEIYCDGKTMWTYVKDANEVTIENYKPNDNSITPNEIFSIHKKGFNGAYEGPIVRNNKTYEVVKLSPKVPKKNQLSYVKVEIDKTTNQIDRMLMYYKNSMLVTYAVKSFTPNQVMADASFTFDAKTKPGVTVVDLR